MSKYRGTCSSMVFKLIIEQFPSVTMPPVLPYYVIEKQCLLLPNNHFITQVHEPKPLLPNRISAQHDHHSPYYVCISPSPPRWLEQPSPPKTAARSRRPPSLRSSSQTPSPRPLGFRDPNHSATPRSARMKHGAGSAGPLAAPATTAALVVFFCRVGVWGGRPWSFYFVINFGGGGGVGLLVVEGSARVWGNARNICILLERERKKKGNYFLWGKSRRGGRRGCG
ncbi:hypothetical protein BDY21DRAFT_131906 [Lineolata rhizophorae]|uniref:Uncharacterized protein n=1 Tax=Lineolata rhizophorae TaxID=578093 RepID=A0A6A6P9X6_9PEZI|nr:hypothetical protein BDY21DRAFT_131906 [Lineolata rhizophorae]